MPRRTGTFPILSRRGDVAVALPSLVVVLVAVVLAVVAALVAVVVAQTRKVVHRLANHRGKCLSVHRGDHCHCLHGLRHHHHGSKRQGLLLEGVSAIHDTKHFTCVLAESPRKKVKKGSGWVRVNFLFGSS